MTEELIPDTVDQYLFRGGMTLAHYWIERTPVSEVICFKDREGREFDLLISSDRSAQLIRQRLLALGVRIVEAGHEAISHANGKP